MNRVRAQLGTQPAVLLLIPALLALISVALALLVFGQGTSLSAAAKQPAPQIAIGTNRESVAPGDTLNVSVRITNKLTDTLNETIIKINYDETQLEPIDGDVRRDSDWIYRVADGRVELQFADTRPAKTAGATVAFRVLRPTPGNTAIQLSANYNWYVYDDVTGKTIRRGSGRSTADQVLIVAPDGKVTDPNVVSGRPQLAIDPPSGAPGTTFAAYGSGFAPGEQVDIWVNTPGGVRAVETELYANASGQVWPSFSTGGLTPGNYSLVVYGRDSTQTLVAAFTLTGGSAPTNPDVPPVDPPATPEPTPATDPIPTAVLAVPPANDVNLEPRAAAFGATFHGYARGFAANEGISIWVNTPAGGVESLGGEFNANGSGETWFEFATEALPGAGHYELVIYGRDSQRTLVVPFELK